MDSTHIKRTHLLLPISWRFPSCKSSHYWSYDGRRSLSICLHHSWHVSITWQPRGTRVQHRMSLPVPSQSTLHHSQFLMVKNKNKYLLAKKTYNFQFTNIIAVSTNFLHGVIEKSYFTLLVFFPHIQMVQDIFLWNKDSCTGICLGLGINDY